MSFRNSAFTRSLVVLVTVAILNVGAFAGSVFDNLPKQNPYSLFPGRHQLHSLLATRSDVIDDASTLNAGEDKSFRYGVDPDKVPFAQKADGTKGRFLNLSANDFRLQIEKARRLGEVEFTRLSDHTTLTQFKAAGGSDNFVVRTRTETGNDGVTRIDMEFQYKTERVDLKLTGQGVEQDSSAHAERNLQIMLAHVRNDRGLKELMEATRVFSAKPVLSGVMSAMVNHTMVDSLACIIAAGECVVLIAVYVNAFIDLAALCPETIGASCIAALLLHPVYGVLVAAKLR